MRLKSLTAAVAVAAMATVSANAAFTVYTSRSAFDALGPITAVDWGVFGPRGTIINTPDSRTVGPLTIGVASSEGILARHDEAWDFTGDFNPDDHLLTDAGSQSDTFIVRFGAPVKGFGTQLESDAIMGAWTGSIDLYNSSDTLLGTILTGGTRGTAEDNSAPFYGILSDTADISYALFWVNNAALFPPKSGSLAMNRMDVLSAVQEPSSLALMVTALIGLAGFLFRRRYSALV